MSENEDDAKKAKRGLEPLCLFCFPDESPSLGGNRTYVSGLQREEAERRTGGGESLRRLGEDVRQREREEFRSRKRTGARIRRRRTKEPIRNLKAYLLTSVKEDDSRGGGDLPSLFDVLETVKDAWPSPSNGRERFLRNERQSPRQPERRKRTEMKNEEVKVELGSQLLSRRLSMPEELMRKYSVSKEKTSEESETNKTAVDVSPSSSSTIETARRKDAEEVKATPPGKQVETGACEATTHPEEGRSRRTDFPQRVTQSDYYKQGKRIIKVRGGEKCTCEREPQSSTTVSAKDETDDSGTTESLPSSSPTQLPKRESSSGNLSSESDNIRCTCAELSSKETSTDLYFSGKSTLSQTVSDKSMSTQDSTVSMNSVSSRGSTVSDDSNSTTPEVDRTSAKETTTSPDYSPRTPRNRKNRRRDKHADAHHATCPRHGDPKPPGSLLQCPLHSSPREPPPPKANAATNTEESPPLRTSVPEVTEGTRTEDADDRYKWAKLSREELYMMQQLRHRRFVESQMKLSTGLPPTPDADSITSCGTGSAYKETERIDRPLMIPRYSALPRSLSMLVNTSSPDSSHNSDSDDQSLPDSLEDQPLTHTHKLYFDTKKEAKPVRGDASVPEETRLSRHRQPRGRAFFVSIKDPYGEDEMLENIEKIPQPPEKIKNQIFRRHLSLCAKHKHLHHPEEQKEKRPPAQKSKKLRNKNGERAAKSRRAEESKKARAERAKRKEEETSKAEPPETETRGKEGKGRSDSKIPIPANSRPTSSSPERDPEKKEKSARPRLRRQKEDEGAGNPPTEVETTQILEITHTGTELSLQKPQAVIHPSQAPLDVKPSPPLLIPPLPSTLKIPPPPFRHNWSKPILAPVRRSPTARFRQRFEVIPEEKSSSLSSAEEKNPRETLPKFADASTSPLPSDKHHFDACAPTDLPNLIVAKIADRHLDTLPYLHTTDAHKIILFSSKPHTSNSSPSAKGRDALIAMNREDFNRLAKGWMNFYKLNENAENSETEGRSKEKSGGGGGKASGTERSLPPREEGDAGPELDENIRFDCSNTILRTGSRGLRKEGGLWGEEVGVGEGETDSDSSTDYMEPPSPRVPPLPINDIPSDATLSSSDSDLEPPKPQITTQPPKYLPPKKRPLGNRNRGKKEGNPLEVPRGGPGKKKNSGWSVTVAGTVELSRSAPDLEMRLSFPAAGGPPVVSQSDSGFAEESNCSKASESLQGLDAYTSRRQLPMGAGNTKQKWMVTVNNPKSGDAEELRKSVSRLPHLEPSRTPKNVLKDTRLEEKVRRLVERKMEAIWPKVEEAVRREFSTESGRLVTELEEEPEEGCCLSVRGSAVSLERKRKPPTMTERDVTRRWTPREDD